MIEHLSLVPQHCILFSYRIANTVFVCGRYFLMLYHYSDAFEGTLRELKSLRGFQGTRCSSRLLARTFSELTLMETAEPHAKRKESKYILSPVKKWVFPREIFCMCTSHFSPEALVLLDDASLFTWTPDEGVKRHLHGPILNQTMVESLPGRYPKPVTT